METPKVQPIKMSVVQSATLRTFCAWPKYIFSEYETGNFASFLGVSGRCLCARYLKRCFARDKKQRKKKSGERVVRLDAVLCARSVKSGAHYRRFNTPQALHNLFRRNGFGERRLGEVMTRLAVFADATKHPLSGRFANACPSLLRKTGVAMSGRIRS